MSSDLLQLKVVSLPNGNCTYNNIIPSSRVAAFVLFPPRYMSPPSLSSIMPYDSFPTDPTIRRDWSESLLRPEERAANAVRKEKKCNIVRKMLCFFFKRWGGVSYKSRLSSKEVGSWGNRGTDIQSQCLFGVKWSEILLWFKEECV